MASPLPCSLAPRATLTHLYPGLEDGGWVDLSPRKGPRTSRGPGVELGEMGLAAALAGVGGDDELELCCRCPSFCGYECQCRRPPVLHDTTEAGGGPDLPGHVPPGQMT